MEAKTKATLYAYGLFFVIFFIIWVIVYNIFSNLATPFIGGIAAAITVLLAPQKQIIKKQSCDKVQLKWLFSKKVIIIK
jgi:hypothetical protein